MRQFDFELLSSCFRAFAFELLPIACFRVASDRPQLGSRDLLAAQSRSIAGGQLCRAAPSSGLRRADLDGGGD